MNKKLLFAGMLVAGAFVLPSLAGAVMTGTCVNCHTMHNSQDGSAVATSGPYAHLLSKNGCAGCHVITADSNSLATGKDSAAPYAPLVTDTSGYLAGGYFLSTGGDATHHNVSDAGISGDGTLTTTAPGGTDLGAQLTCTNCHTGGGHHANSGNDSTTWLDGSTVGKSYRFLSGVQGVESTDFGVNGGTSGVAANIYYGEQRTSDTADTSGLGTISELCAKCHGTFHTGTDISNGTDWIRHPTDVAMPSGYQTNYTTTYDPNVPLATNTTDNTFSTTIVGSEETVMCLSCHVAHGNGNADMLRFTYVNIQAGNNTNDGGCEKCHGSK